jgi:hypothetical protein
MYTNTHIFCFNGISGSGKTECARRIVPSASLGNWDRNHTSWDHKQFASTLKELHNIKTTIQGTDAQNRKLWMIDQACREIISPLSLSYEDFIETVYDITSYPLNLKGDLGATDRDFMTNVADMMHKLSPNCFAESLARSIRLDVIRLDSDYYDYSDRAYDPVPEDLTKIFIVSDLRYREELEVMKKLDAKVHVIKFEIAPDIQRERLLDRDGFMLDDNQLSHPTQISNFTKDDVDLTINAGKLTAVDQAAMMKEYIMNTIKETANA